jgi:steroid delta-isomerase-like uncharacterized protein
MTTITGPRSTNRPEHISSEDPRAHLLLAASRPFIVHTHRAAFFPVHLVPRASRKKSGEEMRLAEVPLSLPHPIAWVDIFKIDAEGARPIEHWAARAGQTRQKGAQSMTNNSISDAAKAVVRRNTEEVQSRRNFDAFEELFADDFVDHTTQPGTTPDKAGVRKLYAYMRAAFPDFHAEIHWQLADGDRVTTYKTYYGTHDGPFLAIAPTHRKIHFETVDVMRVQNGKITDHWGVGNLLSLMRQIGGWTPPAGA